MKSLLMMTGAAIALSAAQSLTAQTDQTTSPKLLAFEGWQQLGKEATRQRVLSQVLSFTIAVDATGTPTNCSVSRDFRRKYTEIALCRPMLKYLRFEPVRNAQGLAVDSEYVQTIDFRTWMSAKGDIKQY